MPLDGNGMFALGGNFDAIDAMPTNTRRTNDAMVTLANMGAITPKVQVALKEPMQTDVMK